MPAGPSPHSSDLQTHLEIQDFDQRDALLAHLQQRPRHASRIQDGLRLMALHGILDPLSDRPIPAAELEVVPPNYRESLSHGGIISRHRAMLLRLRSLIEQAQLPAVAQLRLYCPELLTPLARHLRDSFPLYQGSEYLPDPADPRRGSLSHQDLCALSFADGSFDLVICAEMFEHVYDLPAAFAQIHRVLAPGGVLLATFPFAYGSADTLVKARHRGRGLDPEIIGTPELHGDPLAPERGSLVYQIPGWDILDQLRDVGFEDPRILTLHSASYGVLGADTPYVFVLEARRGA